MDYNNRVNDFLTTAMFVISYETVVSCGLQTTLVIWMNNYGYTNVK